MCGVQSGAKKFNFFLRLAYTALEFICFFFQFFAHISSWVVKLICNYDAIPFAMANMRLSVSLLPFILFFIAVFVTMWHFWCTFCSHKSISIKIFWLSKCAHRLMELCAANAPALSNYYYNQFINAMYLCIAVMPFFSATYFESQILFCLYLEHSIKLRMVEIEAETTCNVNGSLV